MRGSEDYYYPNTMKKMVVACLNIFKEGQKTFVNDYFRELSER